MKIISVENSSSIYYGGFSKRRTSIFLCYDTMIKMQTLKKKQQNLKTVEFDILLVTIALSRRFCMKKINYEARETAWRIKPI